MYRGNLSNRVGLVVYIYLQDLLVPKEDLNILDKTKILLNKTELDKYNLIYPKITHLQYLLKHSDYTIKLITDDLRLFNHFNKEPFLSCSLAYCAKSFLFKVWENSHRFDFLVIEDTTHWYCFNTDRHITFNEFLKLGGKTKCSILK